MSAPGGRVEVGRVGVNLPPVDPRHGRNGYTNYGCRCRICRDANADYSLSQREVRRRRLETTPTLRPHGALSTYLNWGCRCQECRAARARTRGGAA